MEFLAGMTCIDTEVRVKGQGHVVIQPVCVRLSLYMKANVSSFI